jgi:hypothetical protein
MRNVACLLLAVAAGCGIQNKVAPDGELVDGMVAGDGPDAGSGSAAALTIELTEKPPMLGNSADIELGLTTNKPATIECRLDDEAYHACDEHQAAAALTDGMHSFDARATAGDEHAEIPTYSFAIDTRAPMLAITGTPPMSSPVATAQFHFTIDDSTTVSCQLDAQPAMTPCESPVSYTALADGAHTFTLTGTDGAGNTTAVPYTWTVDTSHPQVAITTKPPNPSTSRTALFEFTTGNSVTVTCKLDSGAAASCATSKTYSGLADGAHVFTLAGTNSAGTTTTQTYMWTVDATAPDVDIDTSPAPITNMTTAQLTFHKGDATTVTCQLDTATPATCTSPWTYTGLTDGAHTFTLKGTDAAGNTATKTASWSVDTAPPTVALTAYPSDPSTSGNAVFQFTVSGATTVTCKLDGGAPAACTNAANYSGLADGMHTFTVQASDGAGNTTSKGYAWTIDTTGPSVTFTSTPASLTNSTTASFGFTVSGATTTTCQLDGGSPNTCTTSFSVTGLMQGQHTFTVRGTDSAGNTGSQSFTWVIDTTPPTAHVTLGPSAMSNSRSTSVWFDSTDSAVCKLDSGAWAACSVRVDYTGLADGTHTFYVTATDAAGNTASDQYSWTIDATVPSIAGLSYNCDINTGALSVSWTATDTHLNGQHCSYPNGSNTLACNNGWSGNLNGASSVFAVTATDSFGNSKTSTITIRTLACQ